MPRTVVDALLQAASRMTVWLLVVALPVYAASGVLLQVLGPSHRHVAVAQDSQPAVGSVLQSLRAWRDALHAQAHAHRLAQHAHAHDLYERHHHDAGDPLVQTAGAAAGDEGLADAANAAASGSATMPIGLSSLPALPARKAAATAWPRVAAASWRNADRLHPERPPRG